MSQQRRESESHRKGRHSLAYFIVEGDKLPEWARMYLVDEATLAVYVPAAAADPNEMEVHLRLVEDHNHAVVIAHGHVYARLEDLARSYPEQTALWDVMRKRCEAAVATVREGRMPPKDSAEWPVAHIFGEGY
jgi:hypothetical protein